MSVLTAEEAREHLALSASADIESALGAVIVAAERAIAARCGDLEPTTYTSVVDACWGPLVVRAPLISVTSITAEGGSTSEVPTLTDTGKAAGVIPGRYYGTYTVEYVCGRDVVPEDLLMGIKELVAHIWSTTQRSAADRRGRDSGQTQQQGSAYLFPYRVEQWIAPHVQVGIA